MKLYLFFQNFEKTPIFIEEFKIFYNLSGKCIYECTDSHRVSEARN